LLFFVLLFFTVSSYKINGYLEKKRKKKHEGSSSL